VIRKRDAENLIRIIKFETKMVQPAPKLDDPEFLKEQEKFEEIIYGQLEKILEKRPSFPVSKFAKA
jgi:hypothetical protein